MLPSLPRPRLKFSTENNKLRRTGLIIHTFSLLSGHTCPGAKDCQTRVNMKTRKIMDGRHQKYRCFSATMEGYCTSVFTARKHNMQVLSRYGRGDAMKMADILDADLDPHAKVVRIHIGGDYYSQAYFDAWLEVARRRPHVRFYGYTKSLPFWVARLDRMPENLMLTASRGGKYDELIDEYGLKEATVVFHPEEAAALGLEIDHNESHAMSEDVQKFSLLIHATQPKGSEAAAAVKRLKDEGEDFGYGRK